MQSNSSKYLTEIVNSPTETVEKGRFVPVSIFSSPSDIRISRFLYEREGGGHLIFLFFIVGIYCVFNNSTSVFRTH